jgi:hypothetical protein
MLSAARTRGRWSVRQAIYVIRRLNMTWSQDETEGCPPRQTEGCPPNRGVRSPFASGLCLPLFGPAGRPARDRPAPSLSVSTYYKDLMGTAGHPKQRPPKVAKQKAVEASVNGPRSAVRPRSQINEQKAREPCMNAIPGGRGLTRGRHSAAGGVTCARPCGSAGGPTLAAQPRRSPHRLPPCTMRRVLHHPSCLMPA